MGGMPARRVTSRTVGSVRCVSEVVLGEVHHDVQQQGSQHASLSSATLLLLLSIQLTSDDSVADYHVSSLLRLPAASYLVVGLIADVIDAVLSHHAHLSSSADSLLTFAACCQPVRQPACHGFSGLAHSPSAGQQS